MEERLARYRAGKSKEFKSARRTGTSFAKPNETASRPTIWSQIWNKTVSRLLNNSVSLWIINTWPSIPVLGWPLFLKLLLWLILFGLFVEIEFGMVYVLLSSFYFIYANTRTGEKLKNEPSAYSVFNPNCERLQGSLTAEQFESEIRYGSGNVK